MIVGGGMPKETRNRGTGTCSRQYVRLERCERARRHASLIQNKHSATGMRAQNTHNGIHYYQMQLEYKQTNKQTTHRLTLN